MSIVVCTVLALTLLPSSAGIRECAPLATAAVVEQPRNPTVYVANWYYPDSSIVRIQVGNDQSADVRNVDAPGLWAPAALALDEAGDLWIANHDIDGDPEASVTAYEMGSGGGPKAVATIRSGVSSPDGIAFDRGGNLYVANGGDNSITVYSASELLSNPRPALTLRSLEIRAPAAIAFDQHGDLWVADVFTGSVVRFAGCFPTFSALPSATIRRGLTFPYAIAFDASGNLWVANWFTGKVPGAYFNSVVEYPAASLANDPKPAAIISRQMFNPSGLAFDADGNLWVTGGNSLVARYPARALTKDPQPDILLHLGYTIGKDIPFGIAISPIPANTPLLQGQ